MDRFSWLETARIELQPEEKHVTIQTNVRLYDGEDKTTFDSGQLNLTSHRLAWVDQQQSNRTIIMDLSLVKKVEQESSGMFKSAKVILHLKLPPTEKPLGPKKSSYNNHIKLSFRSGGSDEFAHVLKDVLSKKQWEMIQKQPEQTNQKAPPQVSHRHAGIGGIERRLEEKYKQTDDKINQAFKDLDALMEKAKDMVNIAEKFSSKLQDKQISITDDETVQFKGYLLSMGIDNPVTRETHGSGVKYHEELAKQLATFLKDQIEDEGGVMTLTDVYCRFNRARGMELISPDDLINASKMFEKLHLPMRLRGFDSGVMVIESMSHTEEQLIQTTVEKVEEEGSLTSEELGRALGLAITLARERLLLAEKNGRLCRDDSVEGLRFYPNRFLLEV